MTADRYGGGSMTGSTHYQATLGSYLRQLHGAEADMRALRDRILEEHPGATVLDDEIIVNKDYSEIEAKVFGCTKQVLAYAYGGAPKEDKE